jgi:hypothetical protein
MKVLSSYGSLVLPFMRLVFTDLLPPREDASMICLTLDEPRLLIDPRFFEAFGGIFGSK